MRDDGALDGPRAHGAETLYNREHHARSGGMAGRPAHVPRMEQSRGEPPSCLSADDAGRHSADGERAPAFSRVARRAGSSRASGPGRRASLSGGRQPLAPRTICRRLRQSHRTQLRRCNNRESHARNILRTARLRVRRVTDCVGIELSSVGALVAPASRAGRGHASLPARDRPRMDLLAHGSEAVSRFGQSLMTVSPVSPLTLYSLLGNHATTEALKTGRVSSPLIAFEYADVKVPNTQFKAMMRDQKYDFGELAIATYLQGYERGKPYMLLPATILGRNQHHTIFY